MAEEFEILFSVNKTDQCPREGYQENDTCYPRADAYQDGQEAHHGDDRANDLKGGVQNLNRSMPCFTICVFQLFVEVRRVKARQIYFLCLGHDHHTDVIAD